MNNFIKPIREYLLSFAPLPEAYFSELEKEIKEKHIEDGHYFSKEGMIPREVGFLLSGVLRIYNLDEKGQEWNKAFLQSPDIVLGNIEYDKRAVTNIQALTDCNIIYVSMSFFKNSLRKYPEMARVEQALLGNLMSRKSDREMDLLSLSAKERFLKFKEKSPELLDKISQYHIASYLGITPTQLSRIKGALD